MPLYSQKNVVTTLHQGNHFVTDGNHYNKPQPIELQSCGSPISISPSTTYELRECYEREGGKSARVTVSGAVTESTSQCNMTCLNMT